MSEYVRWLLRFHQQRLESLAPESAQKNINLQVLRSLKVPVLPGDVIERFANVATHARSAAIQLDMSADRLDQLFASLEDWAFSGAV
jgi:type I restriction enzyme S subunit